MTLLRLAPACLGGERPAEVARIVEAIVSAGRRGRSLPWHTHSAVDGELTLANTREQ